MFGTKFNKEAFARGYGKIKNQLGNASFRTKAILGNIDENVKMAKKCIMYCNRRFSITQVPIKQTL